MVRLRLIFHKYWDNHFLILNVLEDWNDCLSGNVYGYMIENPDGDEEGGCWGFYGDPEESGLLVQAKDEAEQMIKDAEKEKRAEKKRLAENTDDLRRDLREIANQAVDRLRLFKADDKLKQAVNRNIKSILTILEK